MDLSYEVNELVLFADNTEEIRTPIVRLFERAARYRDDPATGHTPGYLAAELGSQMALAVEAYRREIGDPERLGYHAFGSEVRAEAVGEYLDEFEAWYATDWQTLKA